MSRGAARLFFLAFALIAGFVPGGCSSNNSPAGLPTTKIDIKGRPFTMEVASTGPQRHTGLMARDALPDDHGMIFIFARPDVYSFWMHNTRIPLDIIWLSAQGDVVYVTTMAAYDERGRENQDPALFVIELNAGKALQLGLKRGDHINLPDDVLKTKGDASDD